VEVVRRLLALVLPTSASKSILDESEEPNPPTKPSTKKPQKTKHNEAGGETLFKSDVLRRILGFCGRETYKIVSDFEWYIRVLSAMVWVRSVGVGSEVGEQLVDVVVRVRNVRGYAVKAVVKIHPFFFILLSSLCLIQFSV
jgi:hypothetical protein